MVPPLVALVLAAFAGPLVDEEDGVRNSVLGPGDLDGDGRPDLVVAGRPEEGRLGADEPRVVWVLAGSDGRVLRERRYVDSAVLAPAGDFDRDGVLDFALADGSAVRIFSLAEPAVAYGGVVQGFHVGRRVLALAGGRDVDGDGFPELAVGVAPAQVELHSWPAHAAGGGRGVPLELPARDGIEQAEGVGVALLPDVDGDGLADVAVAAFRGTWGPEPLRAAVDVVAGADGRHLVGLAPPAARPDSLYWGFEIASAGDVDGDGHADLLVADPRSYVDVLSLRTRGVLHTLRYHIGYMRSEGTSIGAVGDVDGDGRDDFLVAGNESSLDCDGSFAWIHSGADASVLRRYDPGPRGEGQRCGLGVDAAPLGDVDCDGVVDVGIHVPRAKRIEVLGGADFRPLLTRAAPEGR